MIEILRSVGGCAHRVALIKADKGDFLADKSDWLVRRMPICKAKFEALRGMNDGSFYHRAMDLIEAAHSSGLGELEICARDCKFI